MPALRVRDLSFTYAGSEAPVLRGINLEAEEGELILLTGPSGCGKSTLCRCIVGLIPHSYPGELDGEVEVFGVSVRETPISEIATMVGLVFQDPDNPLFTLSVEGDVAFGPENLALPRAEVRGRVDWAMGAVRVSHLRHRAPFELSGGEKQRAAIASILSMKPRLIVFDEPTSFLDPASAASLIELVARLRTEAGVTVVLVEHRLDVAAPLADRVVVLHEGRILLDGEPGEVLGNPLTSEIGVGVPAVTRLFQRLRERGLGVKDTPLTVEEAARELRRILGGVGSRG